MPSALEFFATAQSFRENAHLRASRESQNSEHFHCWRQTLPLRGVLFHSASEKETVRDVTEKRLLHRVFIATQSPKSIAAEKEIVRDVTEKRLLHRVFIATQSPTAVIQIQLSTVW